MDLDQKKTRLFESIVQKPDIFYRHQKIDEPEIESDEKLQILNDLFETKPSTFLERYHNLIDKEFLDCFQKTDRCQPYLDLISARKDDESNRLIKNRRFMALQKLKEGGYFSLEQMREREPYLFDSMVADTLNDSEKIQLRPTVERPDTFSNLMEQFDESHRITERRKRHFEVFENYMSQDRTDRFLSHVDQRMDVDDFEMEFDSDDDEGREAEVKRKRCFSRYFVDKELPERIYADPMPSTSGAHLNVADEATRQLSELKVAEEDVPEDPTTNQMEGELINSNDVSVEHDVLIDEFKTFMEQRFLNGEDDQFVDYKQIDNDEMSVQMSKWKEQDLEDAYFADNEET